jgi:hypothetical protein
MSEPRELRPERSAVAAGDGGRVVEITTDKTGEPFFPRLEEMLRNSQRPRWRAARPLWSRQAGRLRPSRCEPGGPVTVRTTNSSRHPSPGRLACVNVPPDRGAPPRRSAPIQGSCSTSTEVPGQGESRSSISCAERCQRNGTSRRASALAHRRPGSGGKGPWDVSARVQPSDEPGNRLLRIAG